MKGPSSFNVATHAMLATKKIASAEPVNPWRKATKSNGGSSRNNNG
jgi:hypothetical protein